MNDSRRVPPEHRGHDRLLVARFVADDAADESSEARALVESCAGCAQLADDLRLLSTAIVRLPTPARPRDFRLTAEQAARARGTILERVLAGLALPRLAVLRPVAGVAVAVGLTLAVVGGTLPMPAYPASAPLESVTRASGAPTTRHAGGEGGPGDSVGVQVAPGGAPAADATPGATSGEFGPVQGLTTQAPAGSPLTEDTAIGYGAQPIPEQQPQAHQRQDVSDDSLRLLLVYGGVALATVSFAILLLAWYARRRAEDRLLD